jgi:hypothetical protein
MAPVYGYWSEDVTVGADLSVTRSPKQKLPTAQEIEAIMSHAK